MTKTCKYCLQSGGKMVRPCSCNDYVHRTCLQQWYESKGITHVDPKSGKDITPSDLNICEICHTEYARAEVFDGGNCLWDFISYPFLIALNLFIFTGFAGYDQVGKSAGKNRHDYDEDSDGHADYDATPLDNFLLAMIIISIFVFIIKNITTTILLHDKCNLSSRKIILINILTDIVLQAIAVAIYSGITGEFFWNVTTYGMTVTAIIAPIVAITIIIIICYAIGACIFYSTKGIIECIQEAYTSTQFVNSSRV